MKLTLFLLLSVLLCSDLAYSSKLSSHRVKQIHKLAPLKHNKIKIVHYATVHEDGHVKVTTMGVKDFKINPSADWAAKAIFNGNDYNSTGWSMLEIETNENANDFDQAYSAGLLEGQVTRGLIDLHLRNMVGDFCEKPSDTCTKLVDFIHKNLKWAYAQIEQHPDDPYWHHVNLVYHQFMGLYHGYYGLKRVESGKMNPIESILADSQSYLKLLALQLNGDMGELLASFSKVSNPFAAGSCSALIKLLPDNSDLYTSHVTWTVFESMLRILKHYKFNYHLNDIDESVVPGNDMSFSSYPGTLTSIDDFYVINTQLVVLETTIGNSNVDLWKYVTTSTNLYWVRNMVANRLSVTGKNWAKWFSMHNSGTYNNEWMIVDYKQFVAGKEPSDGLLTVLEQLPGQTVWTDRTEVLRAQSYWPSYNLAYYPEVYNISGTYDAFVKYGDFFSYDDSPRASIFRRDHDSVTDMDSMVRLMRSNKFTTDPLSRCDGCNPPYSGENAISARSDLNPATGTYPFDALGHRDHGATDMKVTSSQLMRSREFVAVAGPTFDDADITPFVWSQADFGNSTAHFGLPDKWTFEPVHVQWHF